VVPLVAPPLAVVLAAAAAAAAASGRARRGRTWSAHLGEDWSLRDEDRGVLNAVGVLGKGSSKGLVRA